MNATTRSAIDGDLIENYVNITDYKTNLNQHQINCGDCAKLFYADTATYEGIVRAIEQGLDNPFMCEDCRLEYDELAYGQR